MFNGKINYKWPFSIAMLDYQRVTIDLGLDGVVGISVKNAGFWKWGTPFMHWFPHKKKGPRASTIHDMGYDGYMGGSNLANMGYQRSLTVFFGWMEDFDIYAQQGFICLYIIDRHRL